MCKLLFQSLSLAVVLISSVDVVAQVATGIYSYGTFDSNNPDTINIGNLNMHFSIPVLNKAGRGIPFVYNLGYDNSVWYPVTVSGAATWSPVQSFGWKGDTETATGYVSYTEVTTRVGSGGRSGVCVYMTNSNFVYHDSFGVSHPFYGTTQQNSNPTNCGADTTSNSLLALDGSGYTLNLTNYISSSIVGSDGKNTAVPTNDNGSATAVDANGNEITTDGTGHFTDSTGNVVLTIAGTAPSAHTFSYIDTSGVSQEVSMTYQTYNVQTAFGCSGIGEYGPTSTSLVSAVTFADGTAYNFTYEATPGAAANVTGRLASLKLPQGGTIKYSYTGSNNGIECSDGSTAGLTRTLNADSGSAVSTRTYARTTGTNTSHTEVVDGLNNHLAYDFVQAANQISSNSATTAVYYETNRNIYQTVESGTPLVAKSTCYNNASSPCTTSAFNLPLNQIDTYETLDGLKTYGSTQKFNNYGVLTEADSYDFGPAQTRGSALQKEIWSYYQIPSLPLSDIIMDGFGNTVSITDYTYDGTTPTSTSNVPQHVAVSGPRGNLTSIKSYFSPSAFLTFGNTYYDTGSQSTAVTPNGRSTTLYDSTYVYPTSVTLPTPSSNVVIATSAQYDTTNTGLPINSSDPNSQATTFKFIDSRLRPTEVDYPDGGETSIVYESANQTGTYLKQSASSSMDTEILYDGYGRQSRAALANGQSGNGYYQQDDCYDGNGNLHFISYPYQGAGFSTAKVCSGAGDTYSYDVLGRLIEVLRQNGETILNLYTGSAKKVTDENLVKQISQVDGLGRTTVVCEITSVTLLSVAPVGCGTDIPGTGFLTTYTYDLANHKTTTVQGSQTGSYSRVFQSDWLGRPTLIQEPESGSSTYSYAYNATGLLVTRTRPKANQSSSSVLTTTTMQYDALDRAINITYNDGITPNKQFDYDVVNSTMQWTQTPTYLKGRLADMASGSGTSLTRSLFSYDPMGRVAGLWSCAPSTCGTSNQEARPLSFGFDWTGDLKSESDTESGNIMYARSPAGEVTSITNGTYQGMGNPASLVSNVSNGPYGPTSFTLGNTLKSLYGYDSVGRRDAGGVCSGSPSSPSCSGGTPVYTYTDTIKGSRLTNAQDSVLSKTLTYGYDDFNRLTSLSVNSGTVQNFGYSYDRYGNRVAQTAPQGGYTFSATVNPANNQITTSGYSYDAAGNMTNDGFHSYTFDAEGNILKVDTGSTGLYVYDATNRRVRTQTSSGSYEYLFDYAGRRTSTWNATNNVGTEGRIYWDGQQVAYRALDGNTYFEHKDWLGTERLRTTYSGAIAGNFTSSPWNDGYAANSISGQGGQDTLHFATLDSDFEDLTSHGLYRNYSSAQGRWLSPDPYFGSYDLGNPQSFNRYSYSLNEPLALVDPSGLDATTCTPSDGVTFCVISWGYQPWDGQSGPGIGGIGGVYYYGSGFCPRGPNQGRCTNATPVVISIRAPKNGNYVSVLSPKPTVRQKILNFVCKNSPQNRIIASMEFGFANGAIRGGIAGATGGVFFEGVGAVPGAIVGGFVGGIAGTAGGVITGGAAAGACSLGGAY